MARFEGKIYPDFLKQLQKMENIEKIAPQMIDESLPILERKIDANLASHVVSGDLQGSLKVKKARKTKSGHYGSVFPDGVDHDGVRNAEKMVYLEYGTKHQSAKPTLTKALKDSEPEVYAKMQEVFSREVGD